MRRLIEIEDGDDLNQLRSDELRLLVEKAMPEVYESGMAALLLSMASREKDKSMLVDLASKLVSMLFAKRGNTKFLLDVTPPEPATDAVPDPLFTSRPAVLSQKTVPSDSRPGHIHVITFENGSAVHCTCESFLYNSGKGKMSCKHTDRENGARRY